jgi:GTP-binding protein
MRKFPKVVIVGFPNVGKSSLFNRLLGEKKSLVHSLSGMTRDCVSARCRLDDRNFQLVDTGGIFGTRDEPLSAKVREKVWQAARSADVLVFVLDGKRDISPAEEEMYFSLKKLGKPVLIVVNKVDSPAGGDKLAEYYRLGDKDIIPISAEHRLNIDEVRERIADLLPSMPLDVEEKPLRIAIVGRVNVGKSSIINRLCGEERLLVSEVPGTTRDSTDTVILRDRKPFCLVDTAGIRKFSGAADNREKAGIVKAKMNIGNADVICLVLDARDFPTRQDAHIAHLAQESGKPMIIVLNKWDLVETERVDPEEVRSLVRTKLSFVSYAPLLFISARTGQRVIKILDKAEEVFQNSRKRIETARMNEFLEWINEEHPPRSRDGSKIKVKYMTQQGVAPPTFVLFGHSRTSLLPAYEKSLIGLLREKYDFWGTPIRVFLRKS